MWLFKKESALTRLYRVLVTGTYIVMSEIQGRNRRQRSSCLSVWKLSTSIRWMTLSRQFSSLKDSAASSSQYGMLCADVLDLLVWWWRLVLHVSRIKYTVGSFLLSRVLWSQAYCWHCHAVVMCFTSFKFFVIRCHWSCYPFFHIMLLSSSRCTHSFVLVCFIMGFAFWQGISTYVLIAIIQVSLG